MILRHGTVAGLDIEYLQRSFLGKSFVGKNGLLLDIVKSIVQPESKSFEVVFVIAFFVSKNRFRRLKPISKLLRKCFLSPSHAKENN